MSQEYRHRDTEEQRRIDTETQRHRETEKKKTGGDMNREFSEEDYPLKALREVEKVRAAKAASPKGSDSKARGNAPGLWVRQDGALKGRNKPLSPRGRAPSGLRCGRTSVPQALPGAGEYKPFRLNGRQQGDFFNNPPETSCSVQSRFFDFSVSLRLGVPDASGSFAPHQACLPDGGRHVETDGTLG